MLYLFDKEQTICVYDYFWNRPTLLCFIVSKRNPSPPLDGSSSMISYPIILKVIVLIVMIVTHILVITILVIVMAMVIMIIMITISGLLLMLNADV